jgi:hypothetical protein
MRSCRCASHDLYVGGCQWFLFPFRIHPDEERLPEYPTVKAFNVQAKVLARKPLPSCFREVFVVTESQKTSRSCLIQIEVLLWPVWGGHPLRRAPLEDHLWAFFGILWRILLLCDTLLDGIFHDTNKYSSLSHCWFLVWFGFFVDSRTIIGRFNGEDRTFPYYIFVLTIGSDTMQPIISFMLMVASLSRSYTTDTHYTRSISFNF